MKMNLLALSVFVLLASCSKNVREVSTWESVNNSGNITCINPAGGTPVLFVSRLNKTQVRSDLAPESVIVTSSKVESGNSFVVRKELRRYVPSYGTYEAQLSYLDVLVEIATDGGNLILTPRKKNSDQSSLIGKWPIPKMDLQELAGYVGLNCRVNDAQQ